MKDLHMMHCFLLGDINKLPPAKQSHHREFDGKISMSAKKINSIVAREVAGTVRLLRTSTAVRPHSSDLGAFVVDSQQLTNQREEGGRRSSACSQRRDARS